MLAIICHVERLYIGYLIKYIWHYKEFKLRFIRQTVNVSQRKILRYQAIKTK